MKHRLAALDWMRGIVMILMATDHASEAYNAGRPVTDAVLLYNPAQALDSLQFFHRWLSHLCAPTFLFLAGTALALSIERKTARGVTAWPIDRDMLIRGLVILAVDLFFINIFWFPGALLLQVMYAIGISMLIMIPMRRLPSGWLVAVALLTLVVSEPFLGQQIMVANEPLSILNAFLFTPGAIDTPIESGTLDVIFVAYPALGWWAMMALGWAFGRFLVRRSDSRATAATLTGSSGAASGAAPAGSLAGSSAGSTAGSSAWSPAKLMAVTGAGAMALFVALRALNEFGNMRLLRLDGSLLQWLHVSKYPPSLTFTALELGIMALILALLFLRQDALGERVKTRGPVLVFGQTAFFFYVAHIFFLEISSRLLGVQQQLGLAESTIATFLVMVLLYPLCLWYRGYKSTHPRSIARYL